MECITECETNKFCSITDVTYLEEGFWAPEAIAAVSEQIVKHNDSQITIGVGVSVMSLI